eukprot:360600-Chlamydomonas_euryale.AAC.10
MAVDQCYVLTHVPTTWAYGPGCAATAVCSRAPLASRATSGVCSRGLLARRATSEYAAGAPTPIGALDWKEASPSVVAVSCRPPSPTPLSVPRAFELQQPARPPTPPPCTLIAPAQLRRPRGVARRSSARRNAFYAAARRPRRVLSRAASRPLTCRAPPRATAPRPGPPASTCPPAGPPRATRSSARGPVDNIGRRKRADVLAHAHHQLLAQHLARLGSLHKGDVRVDALAFDRVLVADNGGLRTAWVQHQRGLYLGGADAVAAHLRGTKVWTGVDA